MNYLAQIILTCVDIAALVGVLVFFLSKLTAQLTEVNGTLVDIAGGVKAIEDHCSIIGYGADAVNDALAGAAGNLTVAVTAAEAMVRSRG